MPNVYDAEFDEPRRYPGFDCDRARVGRQAGAERLGLSVWSIPPGQTAYPYHYHLGEEEIVVLLSGTLSLRTPAGWRELEEGEVVSFPTGERGAHQVVNPGASEARMLAISTGGAPDILIYVDSGKLGAFERLPGGGGLYEVFRLADAIDYWEGEESPAF